MDERGAKRGENGSGQRFEVTVFTGPKSGLPFGSPLTPPHQRMPFQGPGLVSCCGLTIVCGEEEISVGIPAHRSLCGG